jgi:hypothetical protein
MVSLKRILKDHREAGSVNGLLALWGFIDDTAFLTKAGAIGVVYRLHGPDDECLDHDERRAVTQRFEQALRQLTESFRIYQYLIKRQARPIPATTHAHPVVREALERRSAYFATKAADLFELEAYLVVLFEGWTPRPSLPGRLASMVRSPRTAWRELFSATAMAAAIDARLARAGAHLHQRAQAFAAQLADTLHPVLLPKAEAFRSFRRLLNYTPYKADYAALTHDTHLDFSVSGSSIDCHRDHLEIDGYGVKVLTMKEPPAKTFAHMLHDLYRVPSTFIACLEWQRRSNASMRGDLRARMRHFFNMRISMINYFSPQTRPEDMLVDSSATATVTELGQGLTEM